MRAPTPAFGTVSLLVCWLPVRVLSGRVDAAGSPAERDEGLAPAGSIFAAGVWHLQQTFRRLHSRHWGIPEPAPPAASNDETGAAARARARVNAHVLFNIMFLLSLRIWRGDWAFNARSVRSVMSPSTLHADSFDVASNSLRITIPSRTRKRPAKLALSRDESAPDRSADAGASG